MSMYNLIEYNNNYSKSFGSLWKCYRDEPDDTAKANSKSFKPKIRITGNTPAVGNTRGVEIAVPLINLSNLWRILEMPLINSKINLILTWFADCVISAATEVKKFAITDTKLYVLILTLSIQNNAKLLQELKPGFKRTLNWNKYQSK